MHIDLIFVRIALYFYRISAETSFIVRRYRTFPSFYDDTSELYLLFMRASDHLLHILISIDDASVDCATRTHKFFR